MANSVKAVGQINLHQQIETFDIISTTLQASIKNRSINSLIFQNDNKLRLSDNRTFSQFRNIYMSVGLITQASGSAYVEIGKTKVICSVHGPREKKRLQFSTQGKVNCEIKSTTFAARSLNKIQEKQDFSEVSTLVKQSLEAAIILNKYPKSAIDIFPFIIEADGNVTSAITMCASLALANAGIELFDLVASCSSSLVNDNILIDPSLNEEKFARANLTLAVMPSLNEITQIIQTGEFQLKQLDESIQLCHDGCIKLHKLMTNCLIEHCKSKKESLDQQIQIQNQNNVFENQQHLQMLERFNYNPIFKQKF
eukprot:TRINITY_DN1583_c2_g4_i1.p1 TRINITY_DN1583_c2_g4~~TRINITY_DN1583_c2_g4_i1.p1  ORF type:complete len:329 (-),score=126.69 TRINITY_DN1583_c2_g4_i1:154-1086(-)